MSRLQARKVRLGTASGVLFALLVVTGLWVVGLDAAQRRADRDRLTAVSAAEVRAELEDELFRSINLARGIRAYVVAYPDLADRDRLEVLLADAYEQGNHVRNVGLAPDNVLQVVHPLAGNEGAVGLRYEEVPEQLPAVQRAMRIRSTVLAGPVDLVQGGRGLINRTPVFLTDSSYWGMVSLVLDVDSMIEQVRRDTQNLPVVWGARAVATAGENVFVGGERTVFGGDTPARASVTFEVPDGMWEIAVVPGDDHRSTPRSLLLSGLVVVIAALLSGLVFQARREHWKVAELSLHDTLTGLANRRLLVDRFQQSAAGARRSGDPVTLVYLDLDSFKPINDTHGHQAGDQVLKVVAERLRARLRATDTIARVGGDEFVLLLSGTPASNTPPLIAELTNRIQQPVMWRDEPLRVDASFGVAEFPQDGEDLDSLLNVADQSMYAVKQGRRRPASRPTEK